MLCFVPCWCPFSLDLCRSIHRSLHKADASVSVQTVCEIVSGWLLRRLACLLDYQTKAKLCEQKLQQDLLLCTNNPLTVLTLAALTCSSSPETATELVSYRINQTTAQAPVDPGPRSVNTWSSSAWLQYPTLWAGRSQTLQLVLATLHHSSFAQSWTLLTYSVVIVSVL